jgi:elongator complex protein 3
MDYHFDWKPVAAEILAIFEDLASEPNMDTDKYKRIVYRSVPGIQGVLSKNQLLQAYRGLKEESPELLPDDPTLESKIQLKPMRTQSGVTPVTVLTKPFPCPGTCIFCPNDIRMPKSYLPDEPGAQRATRNNFDPYLQTYDRLKAFANIGHSTSKIELIILGGTWSVYPEVYQRWFIKRCFEALNDFGEGVDNTHTYEYHGLDEEKLAQIDAIHKHISNVDKKDGTITYNQLIADINRENNQKNKAYEQAEWESLNLEHLRNVDGNCRCVGLVIETRPDNISEEEVIRLRRLGCTKIQIGIQTLQDNVLELNHRGHGVAATARAFELLRYMGFKIHGHWMANLYGSSPEVDVVDYAELFSDDRFKPDELKIYPCSLLESAELVDYYNKGLWQPYSQEELLYVLERVIPETPEYCRLTRIIRDIPSTDIMVGNKNTNLREVAEKNITQRGWKMHDIRSREIKKELLTFDELELKQIHFDTTISHEVFLQFVRKTDNKIAGFLRLSLPINNSEINGDNLMKYNEDSKIETSRTHVYGEEKSDESKEVIRKFAPFYHPFLAQLDGCAMIREVHVYGNVVDIGKSADGQAQHLGLGTQLIEKAKQLTKEGGYNKLAVISAIGTRDYYTKRGFELKELYQIADL